MVSSASTRPVAGQAAVAAIIPQVRGLEWMPVRALVFVRSLAVPEGIPLVFTSRTPDEVLDAIVRADVVEISCSLLSPVLGQRGQ